MAMGGGGMGGTFIMSTCRITKLNMPMEGTARYLSRKVQRKDSLMLEKFCDLRYKYRRMGTIVSEDQVQACGRISQSSGFFGGDVVLHPTMALRGGGDGVSLDRQSSESNPQQEDIANVERLIKEYEDAKEEWMAASLDDGEQSDELSDLDEAQKFVQESQMMDARLNQEMKKALAEFQELVAKEKKLKEEMQTIDAALAREQSKDMNVPRIFDDSDSSCDPEKPRRDGEHQRKLHDESSASACDSPTQRNLHLSVFSSTSEDEWRMQRLKKNIKAWKARLRGVNQESSSTSQSESWHMPYTIDVSAIPSGGFRSPQLADRRHLSTSRASSNGEQTQKEDSLLESVSLKVSEDKNLKITFVEKSAIAKSGITRIERLGYDASDPRALITSLTDSRKAAEKNVADLTGLSFWSVTFALGTLLLDNKAILKGKKILELGCGTGMLGLSAAACGAASVVLSDRSDHVLQLVEENIKQNLEVLADCDVSTKKLELTISPSKGAETEEVDVILGSELIHFGLDRNHKLHAGEENELTSSRFDAIFSTASRYLTESGFILLSFKINHGYIHTISGPEFPKEWNYSQRYIDEVTASGSRFGFMAVELMPMTYLFQDDRESLMTKKNLKDFLCVIAARSPQTLSVALERFPVKSS
uniref:Methyltransferase domain-containing protein n=1 Tax=Hanusia phi TaxID=3032 RepID=A0A7S0NEJ9_9CRYP